MTDDADYYLGIAQHRLNELEAARAHALAAIASAKAAGDYEGGADAVQCVANLDTEKQNLLRLHQQYVQSQSPPPPTPLSREEWRARPVERMTPEDGLAVARNSKYGGDLNWNDANVRLGWEEAQRHKARGE